MVTDEQIARFFNKQSPPDEAEQVAVYLHLHPEVLNKYLSEDEWNGLPAEHAMPFRLAAESWQHIETRIRRRTAMVWLKRFAAAACITGIAVTGLLFFTKQNSIPSAVVYQKTDKAAAPLVLHDTEYNNTSSARRIVLQDSSVVTLSPGASLWYPTPFIGNRRDVYLKGEARFTIAKNADKPFTVYAGAFATTALGTEFTVKLRHNNISIHLWHGKVVIKATDSSIKRWKDIYLAPGQLMSYNAVSNTTSVNNIKFIQTAAKKPVIINSTKDTVLDTMVFAGSAMPVVFHKLSAYYNADIVFDEAAVKDMSFTGVITRNDSLHTVLQVIAQMNNLDVVNETNKYIIAKKKSTSNNN